MENDRLIKVLVVDDEPINIIIAEKVLQKNGYDTISAPNGKEALIMAKAELPDMILLDIMMPGMDGFEVCSELSKIEETKDIPVIFLTAVSDKDSLLKAFTKGGKDYVRKPFHAEELIARVKTHIDLKLALEKQAGLIKELTSAIEEIKQLSGLLPICSHCKKIRNDDGYWQGVEKYITARSDAQFSHSICPDCMREHYPKIAEKILKRTGQLK